MVSKERRKQSWKDGGVSATRYDRACKDARKSSRDEDINGNLGWVCGEAKWIAFEMPELGGYVRVEREELLQWCLKNVDFDHYVILKQDAYRGIYQRIDRKDKITMLALHDLQELKSYTIVKYLDFYIDPKDLTRKKIELS